MILNIANPSLVEYLTTELFTHYINGGISMPYPIANYLDVIERATFNGIVNIEQTPTEDKHAVNKKYIDDLFSDIKLAEDGEY